MSNASYSEDEERNSLDFIETVIRGTSDPIWCLYNVFEQEEIFPKQEEIIRNFYAYKCNPNAKRYRELVLVGGMRGGKTQLGGMFGALEFFEVITKPDPAKHWGLSKKQLISIGCAAASERQIQDGIFYNIDNLISGSKFLNDWFTITYRSTDIWCEEKRLKLRTLPSSASTAVGRSHKCILYDELDLFEGTEGSREAWNYYNRLNKSTSTFKADGHSIAVSSPLDDNGIIMQLYNRATKLDPLGNPLRPTTLAYKIPTWELNPYQDKEELKVEFKHDMATFWRDFGVQPMAASNVGFPGGVKMDYSIVNVLEDETTTSNIPHVIAIDPATTRDGFGIACGYYDWQVDRIVIDGATKVMKPEHEEYINPVEIREFITRAVRRLNIHTLIFDTWMYNELLHVMKEDMFLTIIKHMAEKENYDHWNDLQENGKIRVTYNEELGLEVDALRTVATATKIRIDHPRKGSKDIADCVANLVWYFKGDEDAEIKPQSPVIIGGFYGVYR